MQPLTESYQLASHCASPIGWFTSLDTGEVKLAPCGKWTCKTCGPRSARRFLARTARGGPYSYLVSLTMPPDRGEPSKDNIRRCNRSWRTLRKWLGRRGKVGAITWVNEIGSLGRLHKHVIIRCPRFSYSAARKAVVRAGFGPVCDFKRLTRSRGAVGYIGKYLAKHLGERRWPRYSRRRYTSEPSTHTSERWIFSRPPRRIWVRREKCPWPGLPWDGDAVFDDIAPDRVLRLALNQIEKVPQGGLYHGP